MKKTTLLVFTALLVLVFSASAYSKSPKVVLVSLFENLSKEKATVQYEAESTAPLDYRRKRFSVDRYSEIPRTLLEDRIIDLGAEVIERQSLNKLLTEHKFISDSGLVDTSTALKVGKMLGADTLIIGTITDINKQRKKFNGYGIKTDTQVVTTSLRARIIDIETGRILFSQRAKGSASVRYGTEDTPINKSIEVAVEELVESSKFTTFFQN